MSVRSLVEATDCSETTLSGTNPVWKRDILINFYNDRWNTWIAYPSSLCRHQQLALKLYLQWGDLESFCQISVSFEWGLHVGLLFLRNGLASVTELTYFVWSKFWTTYVHSFRSEEGLGCSTSSVDCVEVVVTFFMEKFNFSSVLLCFETEGGKEKYSRLTVMFM